MGVFLAFQRGPEVRRGLSVPVTWLELGASSSRAWLMRARFVFGRGGECAVSRRAAVAHVLAAFAAVGTATDGHAAMAVAASVHGAPIPAGIAAIAPGFLLASNQYLGYADLLEGSP